MDQITRFAVYFAPRTGPFADKAAQWLGWDATIGTAVAQPDMPFDLASVTRAPRKYGFHATLRAPFRPAPDLTADDVVGAVAALAAGLPPAECDGLRLCNLHGFLALVPDGDTGAIDALAAQVVRATNPLRAALSPAEIARRRPDSLSARQRAHLAQWGYPFVMDDFAFHLTLTDQLDADMAARVQPHAAAHFAAALPRPFVVQDLCLFGEDGEGRFHLLHRFPLQG